MLERRVVVELRGAVEPRRALELLKVLDPFWMSMELSPESKPKLSKIDCSICPKARYTRTLETDVMYRNVLLFRRVVRNFLV